METQASVRSAIRENEWTVSIDIQDAYLHIPMERSVRKYLRFMVNGRVYQFACPVWLGHFLSGIYQVIATGGPVTAAQMGQVYWDDLSPSQQFDIIGMQFNTCTYIVAPLSKMQVKIQHTLDHWRSHLRVTVRDLLRPLGMLTFIAMLVPRGRLRIRPIQWWASEAWCQKTGSSNHSPSGGLVGLPCGAAGGLTKCPGDRYDSIHRCLQPQMRGAARFPYTAGDVVPAAGEPAHQSVRDGGSNLEYCRVSFQECHAPYK